MDSTPKICNKFYNTFKNHQLKKEELYHDYSTYLWFICNLCLVLMHFKVNYLLWGLSHVKSELSRSIFILSSCLHQLHLGLMMCSTNWSPPLPKVTLGKVWTREDVWIKCVTEYWTSFTIYCGVLFVKFLFNIEYSKLVPFTLGIISIFSEFKMC